MDENEITQEPRERTINELIDLPYSEMTEDEISRVVEFKAECKARDDAYKERMNLLESKLNEIAGIHKGIADNAQSLLESLTAHAIENYQKAGENGQSEQE